jgi:hypothetical protein
MRALLSALPRTIAAALPGYSPVTLGAAPRDRGAADELPVHLRSPTPRQLVRAVWSSSSPCAAGRTALRRGRCHSARCLPYERIVAVKRPSAGAGEVTSSRSRDSMASQRGPRSASAMRTTRMSRPPQLVLAALLLPQHALGRAVAPGIGVLHPPVELDGDRRAVEPGVDDGDQPAASPDLDLQLGRGKPGAHDPQPSTGLQGRLRPSVGERCSSHRRESAGPGAGGCGGSAQLAEREPSGEQCRVHCHDTVVDVPPAGAVDERASRRRQPEGSARQDLVGAQGRLLHEEAPSAPPAVGIGEPDGGREIPTHGQPMESCCRRMAHRRGGPGEVEQYGEAVEPVACRPGRGVDEDVRGCVDATADAHPAPRRAQRPDLGVLVAGAPGVHCGEQTQLLLGAGAEEWMHGGSLERREAGRMGAEEVVDTTPPASGTPPRGVAVHRAVYRVVDHPTARTRRGRGRPRNFRTPRNTMAEAAVRVGRKVERTPRKVVDSASSEPEPP